MLPLHEIMFRSRRETAATFLALLTRKLGQSIFVPIHQGTYLPANLACQQLEPPDGCHYLC